MRISYNRATSIYSSGITSCDAASKIIRESPRVLAAGGKRRREPVAHRVDVQRGAAPQEYCEVRGLEKGGRDENLHGDQQDEGQLVLLVQATIDVPVAHVGHRLDDVGHSERVQRVHAASDTGSDEEHGW